MIKDIQELNFPSYATMSAATVSLQDMGEKTITSQIKIDGQITPDFSFDWEVVFKGEKYIMPLRKPQGAKENTTLNSVVDLTFQHWAIYQLKRWFFFTAQPVESGTAVADKYIASVSLNLGDFCSLFKIILNYYYGDKITLDLNPKWEYKSEPEVITISYSYLWDVLIKLYDLFAVRWQIEPNGSFDKYVIKVGYPTTEQSHIFEYGFEGGLLKVERQVQDENIRNMLLGRGGEKNLPYRYFKNIDPENKSFPADPDWIEELANIYFANLMPATFRSYVQGWKAAHLNAKDKDGKLLYGGYIPVGENNAYAPWAYRKGFTDEKFDPVEYVKDDDSIRRYGELMGGLDNNDEIYPTIQGVTIDPYGRIDEAVFVEQIESDDVEAAVENDAQITNIGKATSTDELEGVSKTTITVDFPEFSVDSGKTATIATGAATVKAYYKNILTGRKKDISDKIVLSSDPAITVKNVVTGETHSGSGIPEGRWRWSAKFDLEVNNDSDYFHHIYVTVGYESPKLSQSTLSDKWANTFDILVKNIWGTTRETDETYEQYAKRVWEPILGDHVGNKAKVVFASGALAVSEDYEFTIVDIPKYERKKCTWETVEQGEIVKHEYYSEWRITLAKSDADLETLGVYVPSTMRQGKAGDFFFFIGIDMLHEYTVWNEIRIDEDWKKPILKDKSDIKPTLVVTTDRVRLNNEGKPDALINKLNIGDTLRVADKRFIEGVYDTLYLQSLTITYREPTSDDAALNPDVEIVLSDHYETSANPVATLQGEVSALAKQVGSISNVEQIVRAVGDKLYLRKDGIPDRSLSPTEFASLVRSLDFRSGIVGGAGWGIYKDENGNWVIEADRFKARNDLEVNNLVINQVTGQGGTVVESAARLEITRVEDLSNGYKCYFDQKNGSVANLFRVDDVAWNNRYTPENADFKFYRRRVIEVGADYVLLSKTDVNGTGEPAEGDVIVQRGNYKDPERQYIKVRDVIGGGYERYIQNLDSVNAEGKEYYFAGRVNGDTPHWLIGTKDADFAEWYKGKLNIKGSISVESMIGDKTLGDIIGNIADVDYLTKVFKDRTLIDGGLVLSTLLKMGVNNTDFTTQTTYAGISGLYDAKKIGGGIAIWLGGDMLDKADYFDWNEDTRQWVQKQGVDITGLRIASGLDRMDGTGYRANGNIWWDNDGKVYADPMSFFVGENTLGNITQLFKFYPGQNYPFADVTSVESQRPFRNLKLGFNSNNCAEIYYDAEKDCIVVTKTLLSHGDLQSKKYTEIGGSGSAIELLTDWADYTVADKDWLGLSAGLGYDLKAAIDTLNTRIDNIPTSSVNPYALTIQKNGTTIGSYNGAEAKTINISDVASAATLSGHIGNSAIHITADERTKWNNTATNLSAILGSDTDNVINKYEEIVAFLATYTEADTLANLLSNKADKTTRIIAGTGLSGGGTLTADRTLALAASGVAAGTYTKLTVDAYGRATSGASLVAADIPSLNWSKITSGKPTTLAGYGITDAYTMTEADGKFALISSLSSYLKVDGSNGTHAGVSALIRTLGAIAPTEANVTDETLFVTSSISPSTNNLFYRRPANLLWAYIQGKSDTRYVKKSDFDELFEKVTDANGTYIKAKFTLVSLGDVQSKKHVDVAGGGTGGGGDFSIMSSWDASLAADPDFVLSAKLGYELYQNKLSKTEASSLYQPKGDYVLTSVLENYVTVDTFQNIYKSKTFTHVNPIFFKHSVSGKGLYFGINESGSVGFYAHNNGSWLSSPFYFNIDGTFTANKLAIKNGTSAQFLKADGSVDSNTYLTSHQALDYINVKDIRDTTPKPNAMSSKKVTAWFNNQDRPTTNTQWYSGITVQGWNSYGGYAGWQISAGASNNLYDPNLYFRIGAGESWQSWQKVLTDANYTSVLDSQYVKKSGDTMTGPLKVNQLLDQSGNAGMLGYKILSDATWFVGAGDTQGIIRSNNTSLLHRRDGVDYTIWDSYNDGVGSGLDADLLDGYHRNNLFNGTGAWLNGTTNLARTIEVGGDANTYYPVIITIDPTKTLPTKISVYKDLGSKTPSYSGNHSNGTSSMWLVYEGRKASWDGNGGFVRTLYRAMSYAELCADAQYNTSVHGGLIVWLRGGGCVYNISCTNPFDVTVALSEYSLGTSGTTNYTVAPRTTIGNRGIVNTSFPLYGNASSATRLVTTATYTAWGQTFFEDGVPKSISGNMSGVGYIYANGESHFTYSGGTYADPATGVVAAMKLTGAFAQSGGNVLLATTSGRVGIGTPSPAGDAKLDVNGSSITRGTIYCYDGSYGNFAMFRGQAAGEAMRIEPYSASNNWLSNCITMGTNGNVIIGGTGTTNYKLDVRGSLRIGDIVLRDAGGYLEVNKTILSLGDVQSKKLTESVGGGGMVSLSVSENNKTLKIPSSASSVFIRSTLDGWSYTIEIDGDASEIECLPIFVFEQSPGDATIKWKNSNGTYSVSHTYYGSGLFMLYNMGSGLLRLVKIVSGNY